MLAANRLRHRVADDMATTVGYGRKRSAWRPAGAILLVLALAACARSGPPAPVFDANASPSRPNAAELAVARAAYNRIHVVREGETLYGIARTANVPMRDVIDANGLPAPYLLAPGQQIRLPASRVHTVAAGESVGMISRRYGVDQATLVRLNGIAAPDYVIRPGQELELPSVGASVRPVLSQPLAEAQMAAAVPGPNAASTGASDDIGAAHPRVKPRPVGLPEAPETAPMPLKGTEPVSTATGPFVWPAEGRVVVAFGPQADGLQNDGINIAAPMGAPVRAAQAGTVVYASNEIKGYGNLVLIKHEDGVITAYAHADALLVKRGDAVQRGQVVARVGRSGNVDAPQLHFEVRRAGQAIDPLSVLPG